MKKFGACMLCMAITMTMFQPVLGSIGPGTDTLKTDEGTPVKSIYVSDSSTSDIESLFQGKNKDDGRIETDKSVMYGKDDYSIFNSYNPGEFSVILSALGQKYIDTTSGIIHVPLDVVLVLDISGSMSVDGDGKRADNLVKAVNKTITYLMKEDENNRVAVVAYNTKATKILPLGRYYVGSKADYSNTNSYFSVSKSSKNDGYKKLDIGKIKNESTNNLTDKASKSIEVYGATYIQDGIKQGADILINEKTTTYTDSVSGQKVTRTPNILLLSDGCPTLGNSDYKNLPSNKKFGDGSCCGSENTTDNNKEYSENDKGIFGYYTILTAKYYKDSVSKHYNGQADHKNNKFFTVGVGVTEGEGYDYISQVLHPTAQNLERCKNSKDPRANELHKALTKQYADNTKITVGSKNTGVQAKSSTYYYTNPYRNYDYADNSKMAKDDAMDSETLAQIFKQFLQEGMEIINYHSCVEEGLDNAVEFTDKIGQGMEIKETPILRYNGINYKAAKISEDGNVTTYIYEGKVPSATDGNDDVNLKNIKVTVTKNSKGLQNVKFTIPSKLLPENIQIQGGTQYTKALPIRLCYKVGPTKEAILEAATFETMEMEKILYTNMWDEGKEATATYIPNSENPYYYGYEENPNFVGYEEGEIAKDKNATKTKQYSKSYGKIKNKTITATLGNNGKLTISAANTNKIYQLPDTGGNGTNTYTCIGAILIATSLIYNRYKKNRDNINLT